MAHIWCLTFVEQSVAGTPWPASRHLPSHALMIPIPQGSKMEKIIDQGKDRDYLPPWAKQCQQLPVKMDLDSEKQNQKD